MNQKIMTVRELRLFLQRVEKADPEFKESQVWIASDEEGNSFRPLYSFFIGIDTNPDCVDYCGYPVNSLVVG